MRRSLLALSHPLADDAAHGRELDRFFDFERPCRSRGLRAGSPYNIFGKDGSLRPASFEGLRDRCLSLWRFSWLPEMRVLFLEQPSGKIPLQSPFDKGG